MVHVEYQRFFTISHCKALYFTIFHYMVNYVYSIVLYGTFHEVPYNTSIKYIWESHDNPPKKKKYHRVFGRNVPTTSFIFSARL